MKWGEEGARAAKLKYSKKDLSEFMEGRLLSAITRSREHLTLKSEAGTRGAGVETSHRHDGEPH